MVPDPVTHGIHNHNANTRLTHFIPPEKDPWQYRKRPVTWNWLMCWIVILIGYVWTPHPEVFYKNRYSYKFRKNSQGNTCDRVFFTKLQASNLQFYKRLCYRRFPLNFVKNFKNTSFKEHVQATASNMFRVSNIGTGITSVDVVKCLCR